MIAAVGTGGVLGLAGVVTFAKVTDTTEGFIEHSNVNSAAAYGGQVVVRALQDTEINVYGIGVTGGLVGVAGAVDDTSVANITRAFISDGDASGSDPTVGPSVVYTSGAEVTASTREHVFVFTLSGAGGLVGAAGSVSVGSISDTNDAYIRASDVYSHGDIAVLAKDNATLDPDTGAISGGFVGIGGSVYVGSITNTTRAQLVGAHLNAWGLTSVKADTTEHVTPFVGTASGGVVGLAGGVTVTTIETVAEANVKSAGTRTTQINQDASYQSGHPGQGVGIEAHDDATLSATTGVIAVGLGAIGASVHVGAIRNRAVAEVAPQTLVFAQGGVRILADSHRDIDSTVISGTGGLLSLSGSVAVISLGGPVDSRAGSEFGNDSGSGSLGGQVGSDLKLKQPGLVEGPSYQFDPASAVDTGVGADTITLGPNQLQTGDAVAYTHGDSGTDIGGLHNDRLYFVRIVDAGAGKVALYNSKADAQANTNRVDLTSTGAGTAHALSAAGNVGAAARSQVAAQPTPRSTARSTPGTPFRAR